MTKSRPTDGKYFYAILRVEYTDGAGVSAVIFKANTVEFSAPRIDMNLMKRISESEAKDFRSKLPRLAMIQEMQLKFLKLDAAVSQYELENGRLPANWEDVEKFYPDLRTFAEESFRRLALGSRSWSVTTATGEVFTFDRKLRKIVD